METDQQSSNIPIPNVCEYSCKGVRCDKPVTQNSHFCTEHANEPNVDLEVYKSVSDRLRHFIDASWTRSNFFLIVQAGFFTVFTGVLASMGSQTIQHLAPINFVVGFLGLAQAYIWYKVSKLNLKYMRLWRGQMIKIDKVVDRRQHLAEIDEVLMSAPIGTGLTIWLCMVFMAGWFVLLGALFWLAFAQ